MSDKKAATPVALAVGAALAGSLALVSTASAETGASPFAMTTLSAGYMLGVGGEGSCGGDKEGEKDKAEGNCGEGSCGGDKAEGEGSCGGDAEEGAEDAEDEAAE
jgi:uncharacterized low-complexity protein